MRLASLFLLSTFFLAAPLVAQPPETPRSLRGQVIDAESRAPLPGSVIRLFTVTDSIPLAPTRIGATADALGRFELRIDAGGEYVLEATMVGYDSRRIRLESITDSILVEIAPRGILEEQVTVRAARRTRSVEDACCRVESIREEVQQHAPFSPSAVDVLRRYSSCTSTRINCAMDNSQSIRLRGLEPTYIAVLVDGLPAVSGFGTAYGLGILPAHALQTIRIAEGASSAFYGNGAVSGIVDLQTRQPTEVPELTITGNLAGHGMELPEERDLNMSYTGLVGDVGIAAFGSVNSHNRPDGPIPGSYKRYSALVKGNMLIDGATEITLTGLGGLEDRRGSIEEVGYERVQHLRSDLSLKIGHTFADQSELVVAGLASRAGISSVSFGQPLYAWQQIFYGSVSHLRSIGDHLLTAGLEFRDDGLAVENGPAIGYGTTVASLYLQDELPLGDAWTLLGSARLDNHRTAGSIVSPRGALKFDPLANLTMRLMAGSGFKGQALFDEQQHRALHGGLRWVQNNDFRFERSFTLNYDASYSFILGESFGVDANFNVYHTEIDGKGVLDSDSLAAGALFMINSDQPARLRGLEIQLRPTFGENWSGSLALAVIDYRLRNDMGDFDRIPLAPALNLDASVMYRNAEIGLTGEIWGSHIGRQALPSNPFGLTESTPYTLVNARLEKEFGNISIYAGINNLLDVVQTDTMPLSFASGEGHDAGAVWAPIEGRESFVGIRLMLMGVE